VGAGSDAPEKTAVKIGFIPLTDCSSVVMASVMEFDKKYGIKIVPTKEASWASVRDKLVNGELDAAHVLYGLIYGVQMGIGDQRKDMAVLMNLNHNAGGHAVEETHEKGVKDGATLKALMARKNANTRCAHFPHRHARHWIYYGLRPTASIRSRRRQDITVPPPQWSPTCGRQTWMDIAWESRGTTARSSTASFHRRKPRRRSGRPSEKTLGTTAEWVQKYPTPHGR